MKNKLLVGFLITIFLFSMIPLLPPNFQKELNSIIPSSFAFSRLQNISASITTGTKVSATFNQNTGNNHVVLALVLGSGCSAGTTPLTVSVFDNQSNTYFPLANNSLVVTASGWCANPEKEVNAWYYAVTSGVTHLKVNATFSTTLTNQRYVIQLLETDQSTVGVKGIQRGSAVGTCASVCRVGLTNSSLTPNGANDVLLASTLYGANAATVGCGAGSIWICKNEFSSPGGGSYAIAYPSGVGAQTGANLNISTSAEYRNGMLVDLLLPNTVSQPLKVTMANSAGFLGTPGVITINGCGATPSTMKANGSVVTITMNPTCSFNLRFAAGNSTMRFGFTNSSRYSINYTSSTTQRNFTAYLQLNFTANYSVLNGGSPTAPKLNVTNFGSLNSSTLTTSYVQYWGDYNKAWNLTVNPLLPSSSTERWNTNQSISGTITVASTNNFQYNHQYKLTTSAGAGGSVSPTTTFYNSGNSISIQATPSGTNSFQGWTGTGAGSYTGLTNPRSITLNNAITEAGAFDPTYTITNPQGLSTGSTLSAANQNTSATSFSADSGTNLYIYGLKTGVFSVSQNAWFYQESSQGFQVFSNTSISSLNFDGTSYVLSWSISSKTSAQIFIPSGFTISTSSVSYTTSGSVITMNQGSGIMSITFVNPSVGPGVIGIQGNNSNPTTTVFVPFPTNQSQPHPHPAVPPGNANSTNWSGYVVNAQAGMISDVKGSFIVPSLKCTLGQDSYVALWIGIDGWNDSTVEQAGVLGACSMGKASYFAWYEMYPAAMMEILNFNVKVGDIVTVDISYQSPNFIISLVDGNQSYSIALGSPEALRASAEWILESPSSSSGILPLANFGKAYNGYNYTFIPQSDYVTLDGTNQAIGYNPSLKVQLVKMFNGEKQVIAYPSELTSDQGSFIIFFSGPAVVDYFGSLFPWIILLILIAVTVYEVEKNRTKHRTSNKLLPKSLR